MQSRNERSLAGRTLGALFDGIIDQPLPESAAAAVITSISDDSRRVEEVRAGGSYLSQSSSAVVIGLGDSNEVREIEVRWPDGRESTHRPERPRGEITIRQP